MKEQQKTESLYMKKFFYLCLATLLFTGKVFAMTNSEMDKVFLDLKPILYCSAFTTEIANEMGGIIELKACDRSINAKGLSPKDQFACSANFLKTFFSKAGGLTVNNNGSVSAVKNAEKWQVNYVNYKKTSIESESKRGISDAKFAFKNPNSQSAKDNLSLCRKVSETLQKNLENMQK